MKHFAAYLAKSIIRQSNASQENQEVFQYAIHCLLNFAVNLCILFLIATILGIIPQLCIFLLFWLSLRAPLGGGHMPTEFLCSLVTSLACIISCLIIQHLLQYSPNYMFMISLLCDCIWIFISAPIDSLKNPLSSEKKKKSKRNARFICIIQAISIVVLLSIPITRIFGYYAFMAMTVVTLLSLFGLIQNKVITSSKLNYRM